MGVAQEMAKRPKKKKKTAQITYVMLLLEVHDLNLSMGK